MPVTLAWLRRPWARRVGIVVTVFGSLAAVAAAALWWPDGAADVGVGAMGGLAVEAIDVGSMPIDGRRVAVVTVENRGDTPVRIVGISTSCGCTSGEIDVQRIAAGVSATLSVTIDHAVMPTAGPFAHAVFLATDQPANPEVIVDVRGLGVGGSEPLVAEAVTNERIPTTRATTAVPVSIYYNDACADCLMYIRDTLVPTLTAHGLDDVVAFDYLKDRSRRSELNMRNVELGIPFELQSHLVTFVGDGLVLAGHIPVEMMTAALSLAAPGERLLLFQDRMPEMGQRVSDYQVWNFRDDPRLHPIDTPLAAALADLEWGEDRSTAATAEQERRGAGRLLPIVLVAGLLDGINPCAIAVLLLSLSVLFTLQRSRRDVLLAGGVYVGMIFVAYVGIGLGLFGAIVFSGEQHVVARIGAWLLIALGLVNAKDYFWYGRGLSLSVPKVGHDAIRGWLMRATLPGAAVAGFLVGLCTFPCTGGIYVAILGLLSAHTTYAEGLRYLLAYNVMFVLPLIALLLALGNRRTVGALARWQAERKRTVKLVSGLVMVALGIVMLLWFV